MGSSNGETLNDQPFALYSGEKQSDKPLLQAQRILTGPGGTTAMEDKDLLAMAETALESKERLDAEFLHYKKIIVQDFETETNKFLAEQAEHAAENPEYYNAASSCIVTYQQMLNDTKTFEELANGYDRFIEAFIAAEQGVSGALTRAYSLVNVIDAMRNGLRMMGLFPRSFIINVAPECLKEINILDRSLSDNQLKKYWNPTLIAALLNALPKPKQTDKDDTRTAFSVEEFRAMLQIAIAIAGEGDKYGEKDEVGKFSCINLQQVANKDDSERKKLHGRKHEKELASCLYYIRNKTGFISDMQRALEKLNDPKFGKRRATMEATAVGLKKMATALGARNLISETICERWMRCAQINNEALPRLESIREERSLPNIACLTSVHAKHKKSFEDIKARQRNSMSVEKQDWFDSKDAVLNQILEEIKSSKEVDGEKKRAVYLRYDNFWAEIINELWEKRESAIKKTDLFSRMFSLVDSWDEALKEVLVQAKKIRAFTNIPFDNYERLAVVALLDDAMEEWYSMTLVEKNENREAQIHTLRVALLSSRKTPNKEAMARVIDDTIKDIEYAHASESLLYNTFGKKSRAATALRKNFVPFCIKAGFIGVTPKCPVRSVERAFKEKMDVYFNCYVFTNLHERAMIKEIYAFIRAQANRFSGNTDQERMEFARSVQGEEIRARIKEAIGQAQDHYENTSWYAKIVHFLTGEYPQSEFSKGIMCAYKRMQSDGFIPKDNESDQTPVLKGLLDIQDRINHVDTAKGLFWGAYDRMVNNMPSREEKIEVLTALSTVIAKIKANNWDGERIGREVQEVLKGIEGFGIFYTLLDGATKKMVADGILRFPENKALAKDIDARDRAKLENSGKARALADALKANVEQMARPGGLKL